MRARLSSVDLRCDCICEGMGRVGDRLCNLIESGKGRNGDLTGLKRRGGEAAKRRNGSRTCESEKGRIGEKSMDSAKVRIRPVHRVTGSPDHRFADSPFPRFTDSPVHRFQQWSVDAKNKLSTTLIAIDFNNLTGGSMCRHMDRCAVDK